MRKLYILLANESRLRSDLKDLARRTGATFWLVASPRTIGALPDRHATILVASSSRSILRHRR